MYILYKLQIYIFSCLLLNSDLEWAFFISQLVQYMRLRSSAILSHDEDVLDPSAQTGGLSLPKIRELNACLTQLAFAILLILVVLLDREHELWNQRLCVQSDLGHLPAL